MDACYLPINCNSLVFTSTSSFLWSFMLIAMLQKQLEVFFLMKCFLLYLKSQHKSLKKKKESKQ